MLPEHEPLISPKDACRDPLVTRGGPDKSIHWYYRSIGVGALSVTGSRVVLETHKTTRGRWTSREAIRRFYAALNNEKAAPLPTASGHDNAMSELAAAGLH